MDVWERELLEILIQQPEAVPMAAESIPCDQLSPGPARGIYSKYCELAAAGAEANFQRVLTALEDSQLKSELVDLDEQARRKAAKATHDPEIRLKGLIEHVRHRREDHQRQAKLAALEERRLDEKEELDFLQQLIEQKRNRQGTSAPTDG